MEDSSDDDADDRTAAQAAADARRNQDALKGEARDEKLSNPGAPAPMGGKSRSGGGGQGGFRYYDYREVEHVQEPYRE
eukprot:13658157-Alexandrium_andersonii.AAC.1